MHRSIWGSIAILAAVLATGVFSPLTASAGNPMLHTYRMGIDLQNTPTMGCDFGLGMVGAPLPGFELRVTVVVDSAPLSPQVVLAQVESCDGAAFGNPTELSAMVLLQSGFLSADSVLAALPARWIGADIRILRLAFHAQSAAGAEDALFTREGDSESGPILFVVPAVAAAPTVGPVGIVFVLALLLWIASWRFRHGRVGAISLLAVFLVVSVVFMASAEFGEPAALDDPNDSIPLDPHAEILAAFAMTNPLGGVSVRLDIENIGGAATGAPTDTPTATPTVSPTSTPTSTPTDTPTPIPFDLTAEKVMWDFGDSTSRAAMAYRPSGASPGSGTIPGPRLDAKVGETVRIRLTNELPALPDSDFSAEVDHTTTTLHPHGIELNNESDGSAVTQDTVAPAGGTYLYEFAMPRPGIYMYHPHDKPLDQNFHGMYGPIIVNDDADDVLTQNGILPSRDEILLFSSVTFDEDGKIDGMMNNGSTTAFGGVVLVNGTTDAPTFDLESGAGVRLRLINIDVFRYFVVVFDNGATGTDTIYRVGGEDGLLDEVRIEGGVHGAFDTQHPVGTILLAPGQREDVVILPVGGTGATDTMLRLARFDGAADSDPGFPPNDGTADKVVASFAFVGTAPAPLTIAAGDPLRTHPLVADPVENLKSSPTDSLTDPSTLPVPPLPLPAPQGSTNPVMTFNRVEGGLRPAIDGVEGVFDGAGLDDFTEVPHLATSRWARRGDLLELAIQNTTPVPHPYHLHGFSMQPIKIESIDPFGVVQSLLYTWDYNEFRDVINVPARRRITFRTRLNDRPTIAGASGGADGRWLFHCHIFRHAARGMISELVVIP